MDETTLDFIFEYNDDKAEFVEAEVNGESIQVGTWEQDGTSDTWRLRITHAQFVAALKGE